MPATMPLSAARPPSQPDAVDGERTGKVIRPQRFQRDELELLERVTEADPVAQEQLFERHVGYVERLLYRLLGDAAEVPDALQDVFVGVFNNLGQLRDRRAFKGWLRAITVAVARKRIRAARRRRWLRFLPTEQLPERAVTPPDDEALEALTATYRVLDRMESDLRIAFVLRHIEQLELSYVADACEVSLATIKRRLKKAEHRFALHARREPKLQDWMTEGSRWRAT